MILRLYALAVRGILYALGGRMDVEELGAFRVAVHRIGPPDGEPWLLLHGLGSTAFSWVSVIRALRKECRLVIPELSEIGGTRGPEPALGPRNGPPVLAGLLEREWGTRPVTVAGISLGGWIGIRLALARPESVARLLLLDAAGWANQDWEAIRRHLLLESLEDVDAFYDLLFHETPWRFRLSRVGVLKAFRSRSVRFFFEHLDEGDLLRPEDLAAVRAPSGVVWAEEDGLFPARVAWEMAESLADLRYFSLIPDCGHALHWDRPDELVRRVEGFRRWVGGRGEGLKGSKTGRA